MGRKRKRFTIEEMFDNEENLAPLLADEILEKVARDVIEGYRKDKESRSEWEKNHEEMMKLALQVSEAKSFPWDGAANVKYPLLTVAAIQFAARVDMFEGNDVVRCVVIGEDPDGTKADRAIRISKHMSYQLVRQMTGWQDDNDRMMHALPIIGSMFKKTYYDPVKERNASELVYPLDLVFDYWAKDVESAIRKTHVLQLTENEIMERVRTGIYQEVDLAHMANEPVEKPLDWLHEGLGTYDDEDSPRKVLEQHRFWDFDGDGYQEPWIVTVDLGTEEILRITPRFRKEGVKRNKSGQIKRIEPVEYFTQFPFIPDPNGGNLGIGFGHLQGPLNEVANTIINQLIDAGTLSNTQSGFLAKGIRVKAGDFTFRPNEWKPTSATGVALKDGIVPLPVREPSQTLFLLLQMIVEGAEKVGSVTDAMTGEAPPPNTPATTTLATMEQGLKVFKKIHRRLYSAFTKEFRKLYALNSLYLDPIEYFDVLDLSQRDMLRLVASSVRSLQSRNQMPILPNDYQQDNDVYPSADPAVLTEMERMKKVEILVQTMPLGWPPEEVKRRFVEALRVPNPDALLQPPPPMGPPPELQIAQMEAQIKGQDIQARTQVDLQKTQLEGQKLQLQAQRDAIDIQKTQMEMAKIEAEIRKILNEINGDGTEETKSGLEVQKLIAEYQIKQAELGLKEKELMLKNKEIDTTRQTALETDANKGATQRVPEMEKAMNEMMKRMEEDEKRRKEPKRIIRDENGMLISVGNMQVQRGADGRVEGITPIEETG